MKSTYSFERREGFLYVTISGEYDKMDFLSYPKIVKEECEKENIYKVLFDALDVKGTNVSTMDRFFIGEEIARIFRQRIKMAVVIQEKDIDKFAETVAVNRGGHICIVGDIETAVKWLFNN